MFFTTASPTLFNFVATALPKPKVASSTSTSESSDGESNNGELTAFFPRRRQQVSRLPFRFGCNAKVHASTMNDKCGIYHIYLKHATDYLDDIDITLKSYDEIINHICAELKATFMSKKFLQEEDDSQGRGRRYIWKTDPKYGKKMELVTIMIKESNNQYELITAFKRWA